MKTLREYINLILENESYSKTTIQKIPETLNGGEIITHLKLDNYDDVESYSYAYINKMISETEPVLSFEINNNNVILYHHTKYPNGMNYGRISDMEIRNEFAAIVTKYLRGEVLENVNIIEPTSDPMKEFMEISDFIIKSRQRRRERLGGNDTNESI